MAVGVEVEKRSEGLGTGHEGEDGSVDLGVPVLDEGSHGAVGRAAEIAIQSVIELEVGPEALGDSEDQGRVGDLREHLLDEVLGPDQGAFLPTAGAEPTGLARERDEALLVAAATS